MKSHVTMETNLCPVCGKEEDTGAILLDTRLRQQFEHRTATGWGLCAEHRELYRDGYLAIVEATNEPRHGDHMKAEDAVRGARIVHLRFTAAADLFNIPIVGKDGRNVPMMFASPEVIDRVLRICAEHGVTPLAPADRPRNESPEVPGA